MGASSSLDSFHIFLPHFQYPTKILHKLHVNVLDFNPVNENFLLFAHAGLWAGFQRKYALAHIIYQHKLKEIL
jgi:hypothetical protein